MKIKLSLLTLLASAMSTLAATKELSGSVTGGKADVQNAVVHVSLDAATTAPYHSALIALGEDKGEAVVGQLSPAKGDKRELTFVVPKLKAGETKQIAIRLSDEKGKSFTWKDGDQLSFDGRKVLTFVHPKFDPAATPTKKPAMNNPTIKVYHHLFDATGEVQLTNGPEGQFPHHRGIYFGFNNISYDGKKADVWHCRNGESQQSTGVIAEEAGPLFGSQTVKVDWNGQDGKPFVEETRGLTVYNLSGGRLIQFDSTLATDRNKVRLDGDPQHAGFHFRAAQDVEKNKGETYFLRPDGKGQKGKETNWEPKSKAGPKNLPWNAMSYMVGGKRYTTLYIDSPSNPKEARQSERTYGRIGTYFEHDLTKDKPLQVQYRLWVQEGEMTGEQCEAITEAFVNPPKVTLK
jgi:hypothetical protein